MFWYDTTTKHVINATSASTLYLFNEGLCQVILYEAFAKVNRQPAWPFQNDQVSYLFLLQDGFLLQHFDCIELVIASVARQQHFAKTAFTNDLQEIEV